MIETLANGYSSASAPREISNGYQQVWKKVASAFEGLKQIRDADVKVNIGY